MNTEAQLARARIDDLADQIALCAARIDAALHQLLTYIRRFDELKGWAKQGTKSCAHWLSWRIGLGLVAAREKVRVAHALAGLPQTDAALSRGELSYAKVRAITRVATPKNEDLLLHQARGTTGAELERVCAGYRRLAPRQVVATERRTVRRRNLDDGLVQIELRLLPDEAERVWQAIAEVRRELASGERRFRGIVRARGGGPRADEQRPPLRGWPVDGGRGRGFRRAAARQSADRARYRRCRPPHPGRPPQRDATRLNTGADPRALRRAHLDALDR